MSEICLVIVFNHKYNKNIPKLDKIYGGRFRNIFYLVPFHTETMKGAETKKIISVYETSFCFQGYFAQGYSQFRDDKYSHYIMIGDDVILNPKLNEDNILSELNLGDQDSYIKEIESYGTCHGDSPKRMFDNFSAFCSNTGVSYTKELPPYEEAVKRCESKGLRVDRKIPFSHILKKAFLRPSNILLTLYTLLGMGRDIPYPLFKGYSDIIIINHDSMDEFCRISGVLAAMNIFVENAIPLAMALSCNSLKYECDTSGYKGVEYWSSKEKNDFEKEFEHDLKVLFNNFGDHILYYHPVKLSRWDYEMD